MRLRLTEGQVLSTWRSIIKPTPPHSETARTTECESEINRLVKSAAAGDQASLENLLRMHTGRLTRMISLRIDRRISGRIDVDDVIQEVHMHESAHVLQISEKAAGMRYVRALKKLRQMVSDLPGGMSQWRL